MTTRYVRSSTTLHPPSGPVGCSLRARAMVTALAFVAPLAVFGSAWAAEPAPSMWPAKFVCGLRQEAGWDQVAPGTYYTAVNVLNSDRETAKVTTRVATTDKKPIPGAVLPGLKFELKPLQAIEVDCEEILRGVRDEGFQKGFLIIESAAELAVTAVYTVSNERDVSSIDVEQISSSPSRLPLCADLTIAPVGRPRPDVSAGLTTIPVVVTNIGNALAPATRARVEDPNRTDGDPRRIAESDVPALSPGTPTTVDLVIQYAITGSSNLAALVLTVDPKNLIPECREDNNSRPVGPT